MSDKQHLIFGLHGSLYGISADAVREICWLPELYTLATTPTDILGIFNWRSQMVPVMHLDLRFGRGFSGCDVTNRVIVIEWQGTHVAIVAHEVFDVRLIDPQPLDLNLIQGRQSEVDRNFIIGIAQSNDTPVACLDLDRLIREPEAIRQIDATEPALVSGSGADFYSRCCPEASVADRATFATRASQLKISVNQAQAVGSEAGILVVQIGAEYLGLPLENVVDVDGLDRFPVSQVPIAPQYLRGQINWRGEILPLIELGAILQVLSLPRQEMVVVQVDGIKIGIGVDRIFDVVYLATNDIEELPMSVNSRLRGYLHGVTKYADSLMYFVKLPELVKHEFLPASV
jgi:purine-binding chemotaxis protein CheW